MIPVLRRRLYCPNTQIRSTASCAEFHNTLCDRSWSTPRLGAMVHALPGSLMLQFTEAESHTKPSVERQGGLHGSRSNPRQNTNLLITSQSIACGQALTLRN